MFNKQVAAGRRNRDTGPIFVYYNGRNHYDALLLHNDFEARDILRDLLSEDYSIRTLASSVMAQFNEYSQDEGSEEACV